MNPFSSIRPILAALRGHRAAVALLAIEIALTLAVLCNLMFLVAGTWQRTRIPTGVAEADIGAIQSIGVIGADAPGSAGNNLAVLRAVPGVVSAAFGVTPLWGVDRVPLYLHPDAPQPIAQAYQFGGSQGLNRTLGVRVTQGRDIADNEIPAVSEVFGDGDAPTARSTPPQIPALVTRSLADRLFPGRSALGQSIYTSLWGAPVKLRVIGIIAPLRAALTGHADDADAMLVEFKVGEENLGGLYLIRSQPGQLQRTLPLAAAAMQRANPGHVQQKVATMSELRDDELRSDRASARMLLAIMAILLTVTALGVGALASFWVQQRTKQIGIRRALGATRGNILRYFQIENFLIVTLGISMGLLLAYGLNQLLMSAYALPRLPLWYLPAGALALWLLGQIAVFGPALRASRVPPAIATRSA